jgi:hypothetical protein
MSFFDFLKSEKSNNIEKKFVGRYQHLFAIRNILGADYSTIEEQIAKNKDAQERNEIKSKIEEIERNIKSESFTSISDVSDANSNIGKILEKGYEYCVLQNDIDLEARCFSILLDTQEYFRKLLKEKEELTPELKQALDEANELFSVQGWLHWSTLGDLIKEPDEQHAWIITASVLNISKKIGFLDATNYLKHMIVSLPLKDIDNYIRDIKEMNDRLYKINKISKDESQRVSLMIEEGLNENKEIHRKLPNRP